jgi:hypothetical protein
MTASAGIVNVARLAQVPIVPITYATSRRCIARSWDRFHIALPFGRGVFLWGEPIEIAADLDETEVEEARRLIEERMVEMVREADRRVGHAAPPFPAKTLLPPNPGPAGGVGNAVGAASLSSSGETLSRPASVP